MMNNEMTVKYIATGVPLPIHKELRQVAAAEGLTLAAFLRETLVEKLEKHKPKVRRRKKCQA